VASGDIHGARQNPFSFLHVVPDLSMAVRLEQTDAAAAAGPEPTDTTTARTPRAGWQASVRCRSRLVVLKLQLKGSLVSLYPARISVN